MQQDAQPQTPNPPEPSAPTLSAECSALLERAWQISSAWGWNNPGSFSLLAAMLEPAAYEHLFAELARGLFEPEEQDLLRDELRMRLESVVRQHESVPAPDPETLQGLLERALFLAAERKEPELHSVHLALALLREALALGPSMFGVTDYLLLRRIAIGPRLAGAPPAERRTASIDLNDYRIRSEVLDLLPPKLCRQHGILPLKKAGDILYLATAKPEAFHAFEDVAFWSGCALELVRVTPESLEEAMARYLPDEPRPIEEAPPEDDEPVSPRRIDAESVVSAFERLQHLVHLQTDEHRSYGIQGELYLRIHYLQEAADSFWRGIELSEGQGDWPYCIAYLRKIQDIQPSNLELYRRLTRSFRAMGMVEELLAAFSMYAERCAQNGDLDSVLTLYAELTGRSPVASELHSLIQSKAFRTLPGYLEIVRSFSTLLKLQFQELKNPDLFYLHIKTGLCLASFGYHEDAILHYQKAVERCDPKAHGLWTVGIRCAWDGGWEKATHYFLLALDETPLRLRDRLHIQYDLAKCYEMLGESTKSLELLRSVKQLEPSFLSTNLQLQRLEARVG